MARGVDHGLVDLRSDTVTRPTDAMRSAMAAAEVGDDGYGEDPTVVRLQERFADRVGKQAALFVPTGTMANQIALRLFTRPGGMVLAGRHQHVVAFEHGAAGANAGVHLHTVDDEAGVVRGGDVCWARAAAQHHWPELQLVCVENTHMAAGGTVWPVGALEALAEAAGDVPIHMDGARLFNAEVASGVPARELAAPAATVMTCMSKGLCAPIGSLLAGADDVIDAARGERQRLGGAMRQAGVVAAAGLVALEQMIDRLVEDHHRARRVAEAVAQRWPDAGVVPESVQTNMVVFAHRQVPLLLAHLRTAGVLAGTIAPGVVRLVTHHDVDDAGIDRVLVALRSAP